MLLRLEMPGGVQSSNMALLRKATKATTLLYAIRKCDIQRGILDST
jgi:hypothetical protein